MYFPALPPEVNVGRLMTGAGPAPAATAAATWATYAAASTDRSIFVSALLPRLAMAWQDPSGTPRLIQKLTSYLAWNELKRTAEILASARHTQQAADYTVALASMVHPPEITQNHVTNATLNATNFLGINTGAIAANEAEYAYMWAHNGAVMEGYLAKSTANMTFEPFVAPTPITNNPLPTSSVFVDVGEQVATAVASKITMASVNTEIMVNQLRAMVTTPMSLAADAAGAGRAQVEKAQSATVGVQHDKTKAELDAKRTKDSTQQLSGQQLGQQLIQQLATQAPSQAVQGAQQVVQMPQQAAQQVLQIPQQAVQPFTQLLSSIGTENRTPTVGYFGTSPTSPTLDVLGGGTGGGTGAFGAAAVRGLSGLSFATPSTWSGPGVGSAVPAATPMVPRMPVEPMRPVGGPGTGTSPMARQTGKQRERTVVPVLDAVPTPVYSEEEYGPDEGLALVSQGGEEA